MNTSFCSDVQAWLTSLDNTDVPPAPPPALADHVSTCPCCRAALLLILVAVLPAARDIEQTSCDQCQDDLAAYIDIEHDSGITEALTAYPHVWWHLWTCADCSTAYQMVIAIQAAEIAETLAPMPLTIHANRPALRPIRPILRTITIPHMWFTRILVPQFGATWGHGDDDAVIYENEDESYQITVSVRKQSGQWQIEVMIDPPVAGDMVLTLGAETFRARIAPNGSASVGPIPAALLTGATGPAVTIVIEADAP
jgi:hypothetical protein